MSLFNTMKHAFRLCAALFLLHLSYALSAEEWNVGFTKFSVHDSVINSDVEVAIWYPTSAAAVEAVMDLITLKVASDADPVDSVRGLILLSHGFSGNFLSHYDTAQYLARHGYVVATPNHPDLEGIKSGRLEFDPLVARPRHVQLIIDQLLNRPLFKASLHDAGIGIIGFSMGAYTALTSLGVIPDVSGLPAYCDLESGDELLCSARARQRLLTVTSQVAVPLRTNISGAVLLAPAYGPLFSEKSFSNYKTPVKVFSAENDAALKGQHHAKHFEKLLSAWGSHEAIKGAGHFVFLAPCSSKLKLVVPMLCKDPKAIDRVEVHRKLNKAIVDFYEGILL